MSEENASKSPKVLIPEVKLQARILELAQEINHDFRGREVTAICVLKGSFIFFSDLIRRLDLPVTCEFLGVSSYGNRMVSSGEVKVTLDINEPLENRHVLIVEDIVDSGLTLHYLHEILRARNPKTVRTACLLSKPSRRKIDVPVEYVGFTIEDHFVVGYGLDYGEQYRNLPHIGIVS